MNSRRKDQCWQKHRDAIQCHPSVRHHADLPLHEFALADGGSALVAVTNKQQIPRPQNHRVQSAGKLNEVEGMTVSGSASISENQGPITN